jgi:hypothetical protein
MQPAVQIMRLFPGVVNAAGGAEIHRFPRAAQLHINALHRNTLVGRHSDHGGHLHRCPLWRNRPHELMDQEFLIRHAARTLDHYLAT